jgi:hypothetical protein
MGGAGAVWRHGAGWPRAIGVGLLAAALFAEGFVFGAPRLIHVDELVHDPGAFLFGAEMILAGVLPWVLLRRGERSRGYVAGAALAVMAAMTIGPVTTILRALADRF